MKSQFKVYVDSRNALHLPRGRLNLKPRLSIIEHRAKNVVMLFALVIVLAHWLLNHA